MITHTTRITTPKAALSALFAACLLAACGGSDDAPVPRVTAVKVIGDSLSDSGTYGIKFTVQGAAATGPGSAVIWPEHVAAHYGQTLCARYASRDIEATGVSDFTSNAACGNYAVGAGRINHVTAPTSPASIRQQLKDAGSAGFSAGDLLLIDGGANDLADLVGAYLAAPSDGGQAYAALLTTLIDAATVQKALGAGSAGMGQIGSLYVKILAFHFADSIETHALGKGAQRVAVLNAPAITKTPRFQMVLGAIAQANGIAAAAQAEALFDSWVQLFNADLAEQLAGDHRLVMIDFYSAMKDQVAYPAKYQLSNSTAPVCPATGVDGSGLPRYTFATCTAASLSATAPPEGATGGANWWKSYGFADSFHPTPYFHQLTGEAVVRSLAQAGWK